jgi:hypothetical protein
MGIDAAYATKEMLGYCLPNRYLRNEAWPRITFKSAAGTADTIAPLRLQNEQSHR